MTHPGRKGYDRLELLQSIDSFVFEYDRVPTSREADKRVSGLRTVSSYKRVFGSFNEALVEAGFEVKRKTPT